MSSKTKTTATRVEATPVLVPKLRFPEFRGEERWASGQLESALSSISNGLVLEQSTDTSGFRVTRIETISAGTIDLEKVGLVKTSQDISVYKLRGGDILLSNINSVAHIGKSVFVDRDYDLYHGMNLLRLGVNSAKHDPQFIFYLINTDGIRASLRERANKAVNQASINQTELGKTVVALPQKPEQQKIAECLSSMDELMAAQVLKVDALKTHKKGLMQQLFPREGETQPRLRFPEFKSEWNDASLGDLCFTVSSGKDARDSDGAFDLYGSTGVIGKTAKASYDTPHILVARVGANAGHLTKASGQFGVTDNTLVIRLTPAAGIDYIFHYLGNININKLIFGSGQPLITGSILKAQRVLVPSASEQSKISNCLSFIDDLINAESDKLDALNAHKKGLMQQLFPSPEVIEA